MHAGLDRETLNLVLDTIKDFAADKLPDAYLLELDEKDEFPEPIVRQMLSEIGVSLLFIPEQYGGMGAATFDIYRVCELLARIDVGVATGVFATFLGSDPIVFGGTEEQKQRWMTKIAEEGTPHGLRRHRARSRVAIWGRSRPPPSRSKKTARSSATSSTATSSGSPTAPTRTSTRSSPTLPAVRRGSSSTATSRDSRRASRRTSTGSEPRTRLRSPSPTCGSTQTASSATVRARVSSKPSWSSATPV